jgi:hypothetical protein
MTPWSDHLAAYRAQHGGTLKEAMAGASATYTKKPGSKPRAPRSEASKAKSKVKKMEVRLTALKANKAEEATKPKPAVEPSAAEEPSAAAEVLIAPV